MFLCGYFFGALKNNW